MMINRGLSRLPRRLALLAGVLSTIAGWAGNCFTAEPANPSPYLRINLSTWYEVDPSWPQRPDAVQWGAMPGVAVDRDDNIWIFTREKPPVQVYRPDGKLVRAWGEQFIGKAHQIKFDREGNVWLADVGNHVVLQCTPEGKLLRTLGTPGRPGCDESHFDRPTDMAIGPDGEVFVSDGYGNARVVHFDKQGRFVKSWGKLGTGAGEFNLPHAIVMDSKGRLYVADRNNVRIQVFDRDGKFLEQWQNLLVPWSFWMTENDEIWTCGSSPMIWRPEDKVLGCPPKDQLFMRLDTSGRVLQIWTVPKGEDGKEQPGELNWLHSLALDSRGNIYAVDIIGKRAQKFVRRD
ncbi:MAG: 6-bladed beta-propeller [Pirellulales bacterium]|nr:6-bladed beta-propeller [Pirellulales bacterium]